MKLDRVLTTLSHAHGAALLTDLAALVDDGFSSDDALRTAVALAALRGEDSHLIEPIVTVNGASVPFILDAYATDVPTELDVVFMTAGPLTTWLEERLNALRPGIPVRVLRAS